MVNILPKKITDKKIDYLIKDEHKASKEYRKMGLSKLASDEAKHAKFFEHLKKQQNK
jgi:hypothetical protein